MSRDESPLVRDLPDEEAYNHVHRVVLQSFLTHGVMTIDEFKPILATIMTAHSTPQHLHYLHTYPNTQVRPRTSLPRGRRNTIRLDNTDPPNH